MVEAEALWATGSRPREWGECLIERRTVPLGWLRVLVPGNGESVSIEMHNGQGGGDDVIFKHISELRSVELPILNL